MREEGVSLKSKEVGVICTAQLSSPVCAQGNSEQRNKQAGSAAPSEGRDPSQDDTIGAGIMYGEDSAGAPLAQEGNAGAVHCAVVQEGGTVNVRPDVVPDHVGSQASGGQEQSRNDSFGQAEDDSEDEEGFVADDERQSLVDGHRDELAGEEPAAPATAAPRPENAGCCANNRNCKNCGSPDWVYNITQVFAIFGMSGLCAVFMLNKRDTHGQCLLGAEFQRGGIMIYPKHVDVVWCDLSFYASIFGLGFLLSVLSVNWFAQLRLNLKWLKVQTGVVLFGAISNIAGSVVLLVGFIFWCENVAMTVHCPLETEDQSCMKDYELPVSYESCKNASEVFDANKYAKYDHMTIVFKYAFIESILASFISVCWLILAVLAPYIQWRGIVYRKKTGGRRLADMTIYPPPDPRPGEPRRRPIHTMLQPETYVRQNQPSPTQERSPSTSSNDTQA